MYIVYITLTKVRNEFFKQIFYPKTFEGDMLTFVYSIIRLNHQEDEDGKTSISWNPGSRYLQNDNFEIIFYTEKIFYYKINDILMQFIKK